ncbi:MAG: T9SS type A sorting domain-containing protein [Bacteroidetes bacterium]|nr:T9SS type A sorting domain-containing protein [Bacteroidota bacterium]
MKKIILIAVTNSKCYKVLFAVCLALTSSLLVFADNTVSITAEIGYKADQYHNTEYGSGEYTIYRNGTSNNSVTLSTLRKPFIVVEGFDPGNHIAASDIYSILDDGGLMGSGSLAQQLDALGYDIIILNFDNGGDYIQKNAFLLVELINKINQNKTNNEKLTVTGFSMGGLVARYALAYMESNGMDHDTKLFISYDAPQKGAVIPASIQALAYTFSGLSPLSPQLQDALNQFFCPAAKQMLKYRLTGYNYPSPPTILPINPDYKAFQVELNSLDCNGFPQYCRSIGISLGSWNSIPQRSLLDKDMDGVYDYQYDGQPVLLINIPSAGPYGSKGLDGWIWDQSPCAVQAALTFQVMCMTNLCTSYPYVSNWSTYFGSSVGWGTYVYLTSGYFPLLPPTDADDGIAYQNDEPLDFAPGSNTPIYQEFADGINSTMSDQCTWNYAANATFIPTLSALCYDATDYFTDISSDPNKLSHTPFDDIIGIDGENMSHLSGQCSYPIINSWIINHLTGGYSYSSDCKAVTNTLPSTTISSFYINSNAEHLNSGSPSFEAALGSKVELKASESINFTSSISLDKGSNVVLELAPCSAKPCTWTPATGPNYKRANSNYRSMQQFNTTPLNQYEISIHPNPANDATTMEFRLTKASKVQIIIVDAIGRTVKTVVDGNIKSGDQKLFISTADLVAGVYTVKIVTDIGVYAKNLSVVK